MAKTWKKKVNESDVDEIKMVYDATKYDVDDDVWVPWFTKPIVKSHLRSVETETFMSNCDIGKISLNFMLKPNLQLYAGVDLSKFFPK